MCTAIASWLIYVIVIVTIVTAVGLLSTGSVLSAGLGAYGSVILNDLLGGAVDGSLYEAAVYIVTIIGTLLFVAAFLGCWGACRRKAFWILLFNIVAGVILAMALIAGILAASYKGGIDENNIEQAFVTQVEQEYSKSETVTGAWDTMQDNLDCCGYDSYENWQDGSVFYNETNQVIPLSCCTAYSGGTISDENRDTCLEEAQKNTTDAGIVHVTGCTEKFVEDTNTNADVIIGVCFSLGILNLVGVLIGCFLRGKLTDDD